MHFTCFSKKVGASYKHTEVDYIILMADIIAKRATFENTFTAFALNAPKILQMAD